MNIKETNITGNMFDNKLQNFVSRIAASGSESFFDLLTKELAIAFNVKYCFISELLDKKDYAKVLSFWMGHKHGPTPEYCVIDTPCENATKEPVSFYPKTVCEKFPNDNFLVELDVESYLAVPFYDGNGNSMGHICVMNCSEMIKNTNNEIVMTLISLRVAAEVQRYRYEKHLNHIATHDALTDLLNRSLIMDRIEHAIELANRKGDLVGILYIDLNNFKKINDKYGHQAGDQYLLTAAKCIKSTIRKCDSACRMGGDEFLVLVENVQKIASIEKIAKNLYNNLVNEICEFNGDKIGVTASIGFSSYPQHSKECSILVDMADKAMYSARKCKIGYMQFQLSN
ncbi:MAG: GGDEF domain-containing protein [Gammaproteobacteria bacterium]